MNWNEFIVRSKPRLVIFSLLVLLTVWSWLYSWVSGYDLGEVEKLDAVTKIRFSLGLVLIMVPTWVVWIFLAVMGIWNTAQNSGLATLLVIISIAVWLYVLSGVATTIVSYVRKTLLRLTKGSAATKR